MDTTRLVIPADPLAPVVHPFRSRVGEHVLVVPFSRIFDLVSDDTRGGAGASDIAGLAATLAEPAAGEVPLESIAEPAPQSISLNVSNSCNLSCSYCYAGQGGFGGAQSAPMDRDTARTAIDRLLLAADRASPITIGFLGGEPFANRKLIHWAVDYAASTASQAELDVRFSVTTNGTLLTTADLDMLRRHPFAVTVSIDGGAEIQDAQRPGRSSSFARVVERVRPLLREPGRAKIAARATVTRNNLDIAGRLNALANLGFPEVGFSPLRRGPQGSAMLCGSDWEDYLAALVDAANAELARLRAGLPMRLTNLVVALKQLHRGASSPYPCGAGGGYFSVSSDGAWYACHRAVGNPDFELGSSAGLDDVKRRDFLQRRHVHAQTDCRTCWARYLCSGGCHQEADARSAESCDFIRGWLSFCLATYCELVSLPVASASPSRMGFTERVGS